MTYPTETIPSGPAPLPMGLRLFDHTLLSVLESSQNAISYKARRESDGLPVVLREFLPQDCATRAPGALRVQVHAGQEARFAKAKKNFLREAAQIDGWEHPNIVEFLDAFESDETATAYYTTSYPGGTSLKDYICGEGVRDREWILYLLSCTLGALNYAHDDSVLHRGLCPENIHLTTSGRPMLTGFGSAPAAAASSAARHINSRYSPIEQAKGAEEGPWTDVYILGAVMYALITGSMIPPLNQRFPQESDSYRPLAGNAELERTYGRELLASIDKALAFQPEDRYQSAMEWAEDLEDDPCFQSTHVVPPPYKPERRPTPVVLPFVVPKRESKTKRVALALLMLFLLIGGALLLYFLLWPQKQEQRLEYKPLPGPLAGYTQTHKPAKDQQRILAKPGSRLYSRETRKELETTVPTLALYYVVSEDDLFYHVANRPGEAAHSCLRKVDTIIWKTSLAMRLLHPGLQSQKNRTRDVSLFFRNLEGVNAYAELQAEARKTIQQHARDYKTPETFAEALKQLPHSQAMGIIGREPLHWRAYSSSHLLPITAVNKDEKGVEEIPVCYEKDPRRKSKVYQVAAMGASYEQKGGGEGLVAKTELKPIDLVFVIDTTQSMSPYIEAVLKSIAKLVDEVKEAQKDIKDPEKLIRYGIIGYRDFHYGKNGEQVATREYVTRIFTSESDNDIELLPDNQFKELLATVEQSDKSTVGYMEDVMAGVNAAMLGDDAGRKLQWRDDAVRILWVIGDAPGRERGEKEDNRLCSEKNKPEGSKSSKLKWEELRTNLAENKIRLRTTFLSTDQKHVYDKDAWVDYLKKGQTQFGGLAYVAPRGAGASEVRCHHLVDLSTLPEDKMTLIREAVSGGGYSKLSNMLSHEDLVTEFSRIALDPFLQDFVRVAYNQPAELEETQCLFEEAYVEFLASRPVSAEDQKEPVEVVDQGWTLEKDSQGMPALECRVILTRRQLEQFVSLLAFVYEKMSSSETDQSGWEDLQKLMVITLADPNFAKTMQDGENDKSAAEKLEKILNGYTQEDVNGMLSNFPESTTTFINKLGTKLEPQDRDKMLDKLKASIDSLNGLGKQTDRWIVDKDGQESFIAVPLSTMP